ncbi:MAG: 3-deoxy-manno-octulosonate cytidylyltransferase [Methylococcales symbiont of Hymedesmia sp. n. MRB-2018]|nr:MAG: 3-deoxy-manno-octulosonate cytidylyltransferase [Methylococcales symbiont of Hymedesmia sp. n. MRB-2018]
MKKPFKVVIPARYGSTRLPGKPLLNIAGKPMIAHVCQRATEANADEVVVATDDQRIFDNVTKLGIKVVMTDINHQSGTERINEVASQMAWQDDDIIVNVQGDEPLIPSAYIKEVAHALASQTQAGIATLASRILDDTELFNTNAVKVVLDRDDYALYFSRAAIPWNRDSFTANSAELSDLMPYLRHIGMYAYTVKFLKSYCSWQPSVLETVESLEQLRILWQGESILVKTVDIAPEAGIDTQADLERVERVVLNATTITKV